MGTVKIELDLPNFEKEIELKVIINKDGVQSSTPLIDKKFNPNHQMPSDAAGQAWKESVATSVGCTYDPSTYVNGSTGMTTGGTGTLAGPTTVTTAQSKPISNKPIPSSMMGTF